MIIGEIKVNGICRSFLSEESVSSCGEVLGASPDFIEGAKAEFESFLDDPYSNVKAMIGGKQTFSFYKLPNIDKTQFEKFCSTYFAELSGVYVNTSEDYLSEDYLRGLDDTYHRMCIAIARSNFNKDSISFKNTCKVLKIKHTYKAISAYLMGEINYETM